MRTISKKKKRELQNIRFSGMPKKARKNEKYKSTNSNLFPSHHKIIETVNLVDDSDEENAAEHNVTSLQVTSVNSDKPGENVETRRPRRSARRSIFNRRISFNLDQSCINLTNTTLCENTFNCSNEQVKDYGTSDPTKSQLDEPSQSISINEVDECGHSARIATNRVNCPRNIEGQDDDCACTSSSSTSSEHDSCKHDDSDIVFVSETQNHKNSPKIPVIVIDDDGDGVKQPTTKRARKKFKRMQKQLLSKTIKNSKQSHQKVQKFNTCDNTSGSNALSRVGLREIVIDGSNIAFSHSNGAYFSVRGLYIAIQYFLGKGHKVTAFVPQFRLKVGESSCPAFLQELADKRYVIFTPSREVFGKRITPYDDRFIIQYAHLQEAVIVSNDNYKDLLAEKPEWQSTIEKRLLMYTWVDDLLIFPEDPLGRRGPPLSDFLKFP